MKKELLKELRENKKFSQDALAKKIRSITINFVKLGTWFKLSKN